MSEKRRNALPASVLLGLAALLLVGLWAGLPARYALVDVPGTLLGAGCLVAAGGLFARLPWALRFARAVSWSVLVLGAVTVSALLVAVSQLAGLYGPVGAGGALLMGTIAALILPYTVGVPIVLLHWLKD